MIEGPYAAILVDYNLERVLPELQLRVPASVLSVNWTLVGAARQLGGGGKLVTAGASRPPRCKQQSLSYLYSLPVEGACGEAHFSGVPSIDFDEIRYGIGHLENSHRR